MTAAGASQVLALGALGLVAAVLGGVAWGLAGLRVPEHAASSADPAPSLERCRALEESLRQVSSAMLQTSGAPMAREEMDAAFRAAGCRIPAQEAVR